MATIEVLSKPWRADRVWRAFSLIPFVEAVVIPFSSASFFSPMFAKPPDWLGLPFGFVLEMLVLTWAALGARVVWTTRSRAIATLAVVATTVPGAALQLLIPGVILIMQNLTV